MIKRKGKKKKPTKGVGSAPCKHCAAITVHPARNAKGRFVKRKR